MVGLTEAGDLHDDVRGRGDVAHGVPPPAKVLGVAPARVARVVDAQGDAGEAFGQPPRVGEPFQGRIIAADQPVALQEGVAAEPGLVGEVSVVPQIAYPAQVGELGVPGQCLGGVGAGEVGVGDDAVRDAEPVGERLQPAGLLHGVVRTDGGLDVHDLADVVEARLGDEVVGPVAARPDRSVGADHRVLGRVRLQPLVPEPGMAEIVEVDVGVDERQVGHVTSSPGRRRGGRRRPRRA
ncbi:hypothetical protein LUX32_49800 [Actinomadura madurae]|nr:hypothetical protein [Actinomadura madurae]MCP9984733.1 hypothetical protein [Actinomadura madurae]